MNQYIEREKLCFSSIYPCRYFCIYVFLAALVCICLCQYGVALIFWQSNEFQTKQNKWWVAGVFS